MTQINKKFITFDTKARFVGSDGINNTGLKQDKPENGYVGNIPYSAVVFIKDTGEIWTHGEYFCGYRAVIMPVKVYLYRYWPDSTEEKNEPIWLLEDFLGTDYGSYIIQIRVNDKDPNCVYTGCFSYLPGSNIDEEILLHMAGSCTDDHRIFAKIKTIDSKDYLMLCDLNSYYSENITITFKRMIAI